MCFRVLLALALPTERVTAYCILHPWLYVGPSVPATHQPQLPPQSAQHGVGVRIVPPPLELGQIKIHVDSSMVLITIAELVHKGDGSKVSKEGVRRRRLLWLGQQVFTRTGAGEEGTGRDGIWDSLGLVGNESRRF